MAQLDAKLAEATKAADAAAAEGKDAKATKLRAACDTLAAKRAAAAALKPITIPFKYDAELRRLKAQLAELEKIEAARGLQSLDTIKKLRDKPSVEAHIAEIEAANRGWFEEPEAFEKRLKAALKAPGSGGAPKAASGGGGGAAGGFSAPKGGGAKPAKPAAKMGVSNPWAALRGD